MLLDDDVYKRVDVHTLGSPTKVKNSLLILGSSEILKSSIEFVHAFLPC